MVLQGCFTEQSLCFPWQFWAEPRGVGAPDGTARGRARPAPQPPGPAPGAGPVPIGAQSTTSAGGSGREESGAGGHRGRAAQGSQARRGLLGPAGGESRRPLRPRQGESPWRGPAPETPKCRQPEARGAEEAWAGEGGPREGDSGCPQQTKEPRGGRRSGEGAKPCGGSGHAGREAPREPGHGGRRGGPQEEVGEQGGGSSHPREEAACGGALPAPPGLSEPALSRRGAGRAAGAPAQGEQSRDRARPGLTRGSAGGSPRVTEPQRALGWKGP